MLSICAKSVTTGDILLLSRIWLVTTFFCSRNHGILLRVTRPLVSHHHVMRLSINPQKLQNSSTLNDLQYEVYIYMHYTIGLGQILLLGIRISGYFNKQISDIWLMLLLCNNYLTTNLFNFRTSQMDWDQVQLELLVLKLNKYTQWQ